MKNLWTVIGLPVLLISIGIANTGANEPEYVPDEVVVKYEEGVVDERIGG